MNIVNKLIRISIVFLLIALNNFGVVFAIENRLNHISDNYIKMDIGKETDLLGLVKVIKAYYTTIIEKNYTESKNYFHRSLRKRQIEKYFSNLAERIYHSNYKISDNSEPIQIFSVVELKDTEKEKIVLVTLSIPINSSDHLSNANGFSKALPLTEMFVYSENSWTIIPVFLFSYMSISLD